MEPNRSEKIVSRKKMMRRKSGGVSLGRGYLLEEVKISRKKVTARRMPIMVWAEIM